MLKFISKRRSDHRIERILWSKAQPQVSTYYWREHGRTALKTRKHQPMLLVDIAVPRDVESQVGELESDAYLYSVDDLQSIVDGNIEQP